MTRGFPYVLTFFAGVALVILIGLGVWQLQRLQWKLDIIERREALLRADPRPLVPALEAAADPEALDLVRVEVTCTGLAQAPFESLYGLAQGRMVTRLVSPCRLEGSAYDGILVDRGYVLDTISARPAVIPDDDYPVQVVGVLNSPTVALKTPATSIVVDSLPPPPPGQKKLWMARDLPGMAAALGLSNPAPYFLVAETSTNPDWQALTPGMPPVIVTNNHLSYALTWFGLAVVLVAFYAAMLRKRMKG